MPGPLLAPHLHPSQPFCVRNRRSARSAGLHRAARGDLVAGPLYDAEGVVVADCDLREALHAKRYFDVVGHYGRADVLSLPLAATDPSAASACEAVEDVARDALDDGIAVGEPQAHSVVPAVKTVPPGWWTPMTAWPWRGGRPCRDRRSRAPVGDVLALGREPSGTPRGAFTAVEVLHGRDGEDLEVRRRPSAPVGWGSPSWNAELAPVALVADDDRRGADEVAVDHLGASNTQCSGR